MILAIATEHAAQGSKVLATRCGPIEVEKAGDGISLLMMHGNRGGHNQGMACTRALVRQAAGSGNASPIVRWRRLTTCDARSAAAVVSG